MKMNEKEHKKKKRRNINIRLKHFDTNFQFESNIILSHSILRSK